MPGCPPCTVWPGATPRGGDHRRCSGAALSVREVLLAAAFFSGGGRAVRRAGPLPPPDRRRIHPHRSGGGPVSPAGGILDVFSPERSARCVVSFSTTSWIAWANSRQPPSAACWNRRQVCILPASELLPFAEETTAADAAGRMEDAARRLKKEHAAIRQRLLDDAELLRQGSRHPARTAIWPPSARTRPPRLTIWPRTPSSVPARPAGCRRRSGPFCSRPVRMLPPPWEAGLMAGAFGDLIPTEPELETVLSPLCPLPAGEPAHLPLSAAAPPAAGRQRQAALRLRRQPGCRRHRHHPLSDRRLRRAGALRRRGPAVIWWSSSSGAISLPLWRWRAMPSPPRARRSSPWGAVRRQ